MRSFGAGGAHTAPAAGKLTVLGTAYNEAGNIVRFCERVREVMRDIGAPYELLIVDDGSRDGTFERLVELKPNFPELTIIRFRRNFGQTAGLAAGFHEATGDVVFVFDTDLQQDPGDIPVLLSKINEGFDVVSGQRMQRKHSLAIRLAAWLGYILRKTILGVPIRDTACSPNAYRREALQDLDLFGESHRFLVPMCYWRGFRVAEVPVSHHPRGSGRSKYTFVKSFRAFLDLLVMRFWIGYSVRPMQLFGSFGFGSLALGGVAFVWMIALKLFVGKSFISTPLPVLAVFFVIVGFQLILFGFLADIMMRSYFKDRPTYYVERVIR